jgi:AcrR family transcriptional regulator
MVHMSTKGPTAPEAEPRPLRRDAERNRQRILEAAGQVFAERGLEATLDDIARHAGLGVGTVYRRFPEKELLIDALFDQRIGLIVAVAEEALAHDDPWKGLVHFLERSIELQASDRGLKEVLLGPEHGRDRVKVSRERLLPLVTRLVNRAHAAGVLRRDVQVRDLPFMHMMLGAVVDASHDIEPDLWRRYLALLLDGLRARPKERRPLPVPALDQAELDDAMRTWRPCRR